MFKLLSTAVFMILTLISPGQNFTGGFNFRLPSLDTTSQYFLPVFHNELIDDTSFVKTDQGGNFILHGKPVKLWGVVMGGRGFAMEKKDAPKIAGRMRKMGINFVRLSMLDNPGTEGLFFGTPDTRHFNSTNLDKIEYFISQLKRNGIFVLLTLLDLRPFGPADGVPSQDSVQWNTVIDKATPVFDSKLINLQKEYAGQILTHVNPYTGLSLANDPVLAAVEIANENSLFNWWRGEMLKLVKYGGRLLQCYSSELDTLWNNFLKSKYHTMNTLTDKWSMGSSVNNPEILLNPGFEAGNILTDWDIILIENAKATLVKDSTTFHSGKASAKITTTSHDGTSWHIMFIQSNFSLQKDTSYTVEFWAKANVNSTLQVNVGRQNEPFTNYNSRIFSAGTVWQKFSYPVTAPENNKGFVCITINPGQNGILWFDDISIKKTGKTGLEPGENFDTYSVKRIDYQDRKIYNNNRVSDLMEFYTKVQVDYFNGMKNHLKNTLGVKVPVEGTNYLVGPEDLLALKDMDYISNHAYWDHPAFSTYAWSPADWKINNISMLKNDSMNTITYLFSGFQKKGNPFVIGEYNHAFPNQYQTEMFPVITAYSSFQGADAVTVHLYNEEYDWRPDCMTNYFTLHNDNAQMANSPAFAYAFRNKLIKEADKEIELNYSTYDICTILKPAYTYLTTSSFYPPKMALAHKIVTASVTANQSTLLSALPAEPKNPYITSTGETRWDTTGIFTIETDKLINFTGFLYQFPNRSLKNATLVSADKFGTVTWLALDDTPLSKSRKSLFTLSTRQQNTGMIWDGIHTVHNNWGTAPTEIEPMKVTLQLSIDADSIRIFPMDTLGAYKPTRFTAYKPESSGKFRITLDMGKDKTCWYGMKTYINGTGPTSIETVKNPKPEFLMVYPNPASDKATIRYNLVETSDTDLRIFDMLGREVYSRKMKVEFTGFHEKEFSASSFPNGIYMCILKTEYGCSSIKLRIFK